MHLLLKKAEKFHWRVVKFRSNMRSTIKLLIFSKLWTISELLMTWGYADFIILRCQSEPKAVVHIRLHPGRHGECEVLHEGGEEEEKLHLGQALSKTHPLTWDKTLALVLDFLWMTVHRSVTDSIELLMIFFVLHQPSLKQQIFVTADVWRGC